MGQGDDCIITLGHGLFQRVVGKTGHLMGNIRLTGQNFIAPLPQNIGKLHRGTLTGVVNIGLEAHTQHSDFSAGSHILFDAVGNPGGLTVVDHTGFIDQRCDILKLLMDEPGVYCDTVTADTDARGVDIDAGMAVGQLNQVEHIDAQPVTDLAQLIGIGDVDIAEGVFRQLAHFRRQVVGGADGALGDNRRIDFLGVFCRFRTVGTDNAVVFPQLNEHSAGNNAFRTVSRHKVFGRNAADLGDDRLHQTGGIRRRCGLQYAQTAGTDDLSDAAGGRFHILHIRNPLPFRRIPVGRLHGDDKDVGRFGLGRKVQAASGHGLIHGILQARFYNMDLSLIEGFDHALLNVKAADFISGQCKCNGCGQTDIAATHDLDFFHLLRPFRLRIGKIRSRI